MASPLDFSQSSVDIDSRLHRSIDHLLRITDVPTRIAYEHYNTNSQTLSSLLAMNWMLFFFTTAFAIIISINFFDRLTTFDIGNGIGFLAFLIIINLCGWMTYRQQLVVIARNDGQLPLASRQFLQNYQMRLFTVMCIVLCYRNITKVVAGTCPDGSEFSGNFNCNQMHPVKAIPAETSVLVMLLPLLYSVSVRGAHFEFAMFLWAIAVGTLVFCVVYANATNSINFVLYYALGSFVILAEARMVSYFLFFTHLKLQEILDERQKAADEANATEMRHMIANVAHDLKTPLASFLGGIEYISQVMAEIASKRQQARDLISAADMEDFIQSVSTCVTNMRNTNSFMLMTINRCIDYTKASKGVKLVPKFETIDLLDTLSLPLNCMKDIQQSVTIVLAPLAKDVCSHLITDKQWLQENVLCLLSNAVKYSNDGQVTIKVSKEKQTHSPIADNIKPLSLVERPSSHKVLQSIRSNDPTKVYCAAPKQEDPHNPLVLRVEVEDTGIGLSEEAMATLFSPFKQAQRLAGGTGLGLFSMAKRIEALEGRCGVERRRDGKEGSLFWFEIPYRADNQASRLLNRPRLDVVREGSSTKLVTSGSLQLSPSHIPQPLTKASSLVLTDFASEKVDSRQSVRTGQMDILVVDDSPAILKMTSMMLTRHRHQVSTATNGAEAVKKVHDRIASKGTGFDVVLMDLQMPVMDGLEATRRLRRLERTGIMLSRSTSPKSDFIPTLGDEEDEQKSDEEPPHMCHSHNVVIGVSANSDTDTAAAAYGIGMDAFVSKPFSLDTFYSTYDRVIAERRKQAAMAMDYAI